MAIDSTTTTPEPTATTIPLLRNGDRLTASEFMRRYQAMSNLSHAELIEARVFMPSPVSAERHGEPHFDFITWLGVYRAMTPGVVGGDNSTLQLDMDNAPQPDGYLRIAEVAGGQTRLVDGYLVGAPELIVEVAASSVSYDLHDKLNAYRRNGVREYLVWRTEDRAIDWHVLVNGRFEAMTPREDNILCSTVFPGLWLDAAAVIGGNLARVLEVLNQGIASQQHQQFVQQLESHKKQS
jgi:Uma2 family endonuclease